MTLRGICHSELILRSLSRQVSNDGLSTRSQLISELCLANGGCYVGTGQVGDLDLYLLVWLATNQVGNIGRARLNILACRNVQPKLYGGLTPCTL